ncbi:hypothetical protein [Pseudoxanthomonas sp. Root630]|uniref:hypothetical protein n=1 Tax=Pseudoxanthomonas sp. Root630 TaxID=1736574 RepID=UPI0007029212|nr:hypothetical protein [Pseudoxanthomonas sp. Root630]KRA50245.1 hypothetical protein ASD72_18710 [Pseudoxanthomonas sp. Root630]
MTAGTKATQSAPIQAHATTPHLPYHPRPLKRGERSRREVFVYFSPRNQRIAMIADMVNVALALRLEFDPALSHYIERPRRLKVSDKHEIDITFWTRSKTGQEAFYLVVPDSGTVGSTVSTLSIRDRSVLEAAAQRQGITLHFVTEDELLSSRTWLATAFELLPLVWQYGRLLNRSMIRARIEGLMRNVERTNLSSLLKALDYEPSHVRAVVAAMVHEGSVRLVDYQPGGMDAVLEVPHA